MKTTSAPRPDRHADVSAVGRPALAVADEGREQIEDLVAELLVEAVAETFGNQTAHITEVLIKNLPHRTSGKSA